MGAKVNGRIVPLNYELKTGDIVEILTNPQSKGPSRDWIDMVKTAQARSKIRAWFKKEQREENEEKGKEILEKKPSAKDMSFRICCRASGCNRSISALASIPLGICLRLWAMGG